jgi:hypothetical protein
MPEARPWKLSKEEMQGRVENLPRKLQLRETGDAVFDFGDGDLVALSFAMTATSKVVLRLRPLEAVMPFRRRL